MNMNETGGAEPRQHFEVVQPTEVGERPDKQAVEKQRPASQESAAGRQATPAAAQPLPFIPDIPVSASVPPVADDTAVPVLSPTTITLPAADGNRIEKQWVDKAKAIVAETKDDPYRQKNEMSKVKADYISKRYNKTIKTEAT